MEAKSRMRRGARRIVATAHVCAASVWGEKPADDPARDASPLALMSAMSMMFFLCRVDPKDFAALVTGPGSMADFSHKPFPPGYWHKKGILSAEDETRNTG